MENDLSLYINVTRQREPPGGPVRLTDIKATSGPHQVSRETATTKKGQGPAVLEAGEMADLAHLEAEGWILEWLDQHPLEGFVPGLGVPGRTQLGHRMETRMFRIVFQGVTIEGEKMGATTFFENFYDWGDVMNLALETITNNENLKKVEEEVELGFKGWLASFDGWYLLCHILKNLQNEKAELFEKALFKTNNEWNEEIMGPQSNRVVFNRVKEAYQLIFGEIFENLVPEIKVKVQELHCTIHCIRFCKHLQKCEERKKSLKILISICRCEPPLKSLCICGTFDVNFTVEMNQFNHNLLELASKTFAKTVDKDIKQVEHKRFLDGLEIPSILKTKLVEKVNDVSWVREHVRGAQVISCILSEPTMQTKCYIFMTILVFGVLLLFGELYLLFTILF